MIKPIHKPPLPLKNFYGYRPRRKEPRDLSVQGENMPRSFTADGVPTTGGLPNNTGEWIALFSRITSTAPNGGPAYIVNRTGNADTGAIGISATNYGREVHISRPAYLGLNVQKIVVTPEDLFYEPPLDQLATR